MATLSVLKFNDPYGADRVLIALQGLQEREMITLENAAVVSWPQGNKKPTTHQLHGTAAAGADRSHLPGGSYRGHRPRSYQVSAAPLSTAYAHRVENMAPDAPEK
jgi:uncharacterized membrane protein